MQRCVGSPSDSSVTASPTSDSPAATDSAEAGRSNRLGPRHLDAIPGLLTCTALVGYFLAVTMHFKARDLGRNPFVNATGMLALCTATLVVVATQ